MRLMLPGLLPICRWIALNAMRGLAALLVVLYHLRWDWHGYGLVPVRHGFCAVDFFYVLSGFVMAATYVTIRTPIDLIRFTIKHAGRLLPLHFAVLAAFLTVEILFSLAESVGLSAGRPAFVGFIGLTVLILTRWRSWAWAFLSGVGLAAAALTPEALAATSGSAIFRCLLSFFPGALVHTAYAHLRTRNLAPGMTLQIVATGRGKRMYEYALAMTATVSTPKGQGQLQVARHEDVVVAGPTIPSQRQLSDSKRPIRWFRPKVR